MLNVIELDVMDSRFAHTLRGKVFACDRYIPRYASHILHCAAKAISISRSARAATRSGCSCLAIHFTMTLLSMLEAYPATASALKTVCLLPLHLHHQVCCLLSCLQEAYGYLLAWLQHASASHVRKNRPPKKIV